MVLKWNKHKGRINAILTRYQLMMQPQPTLSIRLTDAEEVYKPTLIPKAINIGCAYNYCYSKPLKKVVIHGILY